MHAILPFFNFGCATESLEDASSSIVSSATNNLPARDNNFKDDFQKRFFGLVWFQFGRQSRKHVFLYDVK